MLYIHNWLLWDAKKREGFGKGVLIFGLCLTIYESMGFVVPVD